MFCFDLSESQGGRDLIFIGSLLTPPGWSQTARTQVGSSMWIAKTQGLEPSLLNSRVPTDRKLGLEVDPRPWTQTLQYRIWAFQACLNHCTKWLPVHILKYRGLMILQDNLNKTVKIQGEFCAGRVGNLFHFLSSACSIHPPLRHDSFV